MQQSELDKFFITTHYSVGGAFLKAVEKTWDTASFSLKMLGNMVLGNVSWKGMSGPVTIANYAGQSANMGLKVFIGFLALISISIGVLNLLPIPILDGGHLMYYMFEFFTGRPVSEAAMNVGQRIGVFLLACMMVLALYNDINRLITG
jgi:regulator of sigma E protease